MSKDARLNVTIMHSTKTRLQDYCDNHDGISMGDVVEAALKNFFERQDRNHSAPDLVLERINQLLASNMHIAQTIGLIDDRTTYIEELTELVVERTGDTDGR